MAIVKRLEDLEHVVSNVVVCETLIQLAEISVTCVYELSDDRGSFSQWISHNINQFYYVHTFLESLQDLDLSSDLVFLDYRCNQSVI